MPNNKSGSLPMTAVIRDHDEADTKSNRRADCRAECAAHCKFLSGHLIQSQEKHNVAGDGGSEKSIVDVEESVSKPSEHHGANGQDYRRGMHMREQETRRDGPEHGAEHSCDHATHRVGQLRLEHEQSGHWNPISTRIMQPPIDFG